MARGWTRGWMALRRTGTATKAGSAGHCACVQGNVANLSTAMSCDVFTE